MQRYRFGRRRSDAYQLTETLDYKNNSQSSLNQEAAIHYWAMWPLYFAYIYHHPCFVRSPTSNFRFKGIESWQSWWFSIQQVAYFVLVLRFQTVRLRPHYVTHFASDGGLASSLKSWPSSWRQLALWESGITRAVKWSGTKAQLSLHKMTITWRSMCRLI